MKKELVCCKCYRKYTFETGVKKGHTLSACNTCNVNHRRFSVKDRAVAYKGGSCQRCGYNRSVKALDFHHRDPATKRFSISGHHTRTWESIRAELDKCDLICSNCHREEHDSDYRDAVEKRKQSLSANSIG